MGTKNDPGKFDCYVAALPDEPMFVLLGRDPLAPILITMWATLRERMQGRTDEVLEKTREARRCASVCHDWAERLGKRVELEQANDLIHSYNTRPWTIGDCEKYERGHDWGGSTERYCRRCGGVR